ncbi:MAG: hypothetical protein ACNA8R_15315, partial [Nitriliruptoraceae bacterium]
MNVPTLAAATWPPDPDLRAHRRLLRLLDGLTDLLAATSAAHILLAELSARLDQLPADDTLAALTDIDRALVPFTDTAALLDAARPYDHIHIRLRHASRLRTDALCRLRRLGDLHRAGLPPALAHTRAVLTDLYTQLDRAGHALVQADHSLVDILTSTHNQEVPTTVRDTSRHPHPGTDQGISVSDTGELRRAASAGLTEERIEPVVRAQRGEPF